MKCSNQSTNAKHERQCFNKGQIRCKGFTLFVQKINVFVKKINALLCNLSETYKLFQDKFPKNVLSCILKTVYLLAKVEHVLSVYALSLGT